MAKTIWNSKKKSIMNLIIVRVPELLIQIPKWTSIYSGFFAEKFKYVHFADDKIPSLLFNLEEDPEEFENIAQHPKYSSIVMDLMNRMLVWRMRCEDQRMENWASQFRY